MIKLKKCSKGKLFIAAILVALGTSSTIAYFTDENIIDPKITIVIGKLDTEIVKGLNIDGLDIDSAATDKFSIENAGSLKQNLSFKFDNNTSMESDGLDKLNYNLVFNKENGEKSKQYSGAMSELFKENIDIVTENGEKMILGNGEILDATIEVTMDKTMPSKYSNKDIKFDIVVDANQINDTLVN